MSKPSTNSDAPFGSRVYQGDDPAALKDAALRDAAALLCEKGASVPCGSCPACKKALSLSHVDVRLLDKGPDGTVKVDDVRALRADLFVRPFDGQYKINIIAHAHTMNAAAQNALLTVLEEPPPYAFFFLLTGNAQALLPTVRSRCALVRMPPADEPPADPEDTEKAAAYLAAVDSGDDWAIACAALALEKLTRAGLSRVLLAGLSLLSLRLRSGGAETRRAAALCGVFLELLDGLEQNASVGSVCGILALRIA